MISIRNLSKYYIIKNQRIAALMDINLDIKAGDIFGIIGQSGAGKSTLIRCLNLLERPCSGSITLDGSSLMEMDRNQLLKARQQMGMIFQHFNLLRSRNVAKNISFGMELAGFEKSAIKKRVNELLEITNLTSQALKYPQQLSGGQKQRVAIARAIATSPKVLLCDEATSALDPSSTHSILELLKDINKELGLTIFLISHEMDIIKAICDEVAVIDKGRIIEQSGVLDLFTNPQTDISKQFIQVSSRLEIPPAIQNMLKGSETNNTGTLLRLSYHGESASQPIISYLMQQYRVIINILQGNIETIQNETVGVLIVEIRGDKENIEKSISFFERNKLHVEILGYVNRDA